MSPFPLRFLCALSAVASSAFVTASSARAQCSPDSLFCANLQWQGTLQIGPTAPQPPPPDVAVVQPEPPPPVYVAQQPRPVYVGDGQVAPQQRRAPTMGLHGHFAAMRTEWVNMGGFTGALRLRPQPHYAVDLGVGIYGGIDHQGYDRVEVPLTADLLWFLNPQHPLQLYVLGGAGISFAHIEGFGDFGRVYRDRGLAHLGVEAGGGVEWRLSRSFAINADLRAFLRQRVGGDGEPEFVEYDDSGRPTGRTTDTSAGLLGTLGATLYL